MAKLHLNQSVIASNHQQWEWLIINEKHKQQNTK